MNKVGNDGVITIEEGTTLETELEVVDGIQFDRSYISPHFVTNRNKMAVEMEDAYVLISEKKLSSINELLPLLEKVVQTGKPLLIIADDVEGEVMAALVVNKLRGSLKVAAVKAPRLRRAAQVDPPGHRADDGRNGVLGRSRPEAREPRRSIVLGRAKKVTIDKQNTTIAGGSRQAGRHRCPHRPDQGSARENDCRL